MRHFIGGIDIFLQFISIVTKAIHCKCTIHNKIKKTASSKFLPHTLTFSTTLQVPIVSAAATILSCKTVVDVIWGDFMCIFLF